MNQQKELYKYSIPGIILITLTIQFMQQQLNNHHYPIFFLLKDQFLVVISTFVRESSPRKCPSEAQNLQVRWQSQHKSAHVRHFRDLGETTTSVQAKHSMNLESFKRKHGHVIEDILFWQRFQNLPKLPCNPFCKDKYNNSITRVLKIPAALHIHGGFVLLLWRSGLSPDFQVGRG